MFSFVYFITAEFKSMRKKLESVLLKAGWLLLIIGVFLAVIIFGFDIKNELILGMLQTVAVLLFVAVTWMLLRTK